MSRALRRTSRALRRKPRALRKRSRSTSPQAPSAPATLPLFPWERRHPAGLGRHKPVFRPPLVVRDGDHFDSAWHLAIDNAVRKLAENVSPSAGLVARPNSGRARDQSERAGRLTNKCLCGLDAALEVPLECVIDFPGRFRKELNPRAAHSVSPGSQRGSLPRVSSRPPRRPALLRGPRPLGATRPRHRLPVQALSSSRAHLLSQPVPARPMSALPAARSQHAVS